ncbi:zinc finger protein 410-like [Patiria miniata]|uniref:C2H2-type domain-containing protein n=1 Tax=Patiria miniata TaxID=46514 RepID=A0A914BB91_PATMI|nr:zinc finger protein 410-like [Patiria miniata]
MDPVINTSDVLASSLDSLATSIACGSAGMLEDTVASSLMLTNHGVVASSLDISQTNLGLNVGDGLDEREEAGEMTAMGVGRMEHSFAECEGEGELDNQSMVGADETDSPDMSNLGLPPSSLMVVNIPNTSQTSLATATLMPILVLSTSNGMQKANGLDCSPSSASSLLLDRPQQDFRQLLRLRDLAHANLICATQESIAKSFGVANQTSDEKLLKCEECGRSFKSSSHYRYHCETHKGNKVLKCSVEGCNKRFAWPAHLKYHTRTHANDRPYSCAMDDCGKTFYTLQSLHVHMRTHTGHKPFKCPEEDCGKSFTTAGNLKNHLRIHTGERPFICDHDGCIQSFAEHSSLRKHKRVHTGAKPYECEICFKVFSQSGSRNTHKRRHHSMSKMRAATSGRNAKMPGVCKDEDCTERQEDCIQLHKSGLLAEHAAAQHEIGLAEITLPNPGHVNSSLHTMTTVGVAGTDMNMSSHSSMAEHDGISLAHSILGGVTLTSHRHDPGTGHSMQSVDQDNEMTMLTHGSMTLSHSILEVTTDLDQDRCCKGDTTQRCTVSNPGNVVVLSEPNHAHDPTHDHTLGMMSDPGPDFAVNHQSSSSVEDDMVYNNAMLQSAASMVDQEHDVDIPVSEIEVNNHHHHHHHHLQGGDIVITW